MDNLMLAVFLALLLVPLLALILATPYMLLKYRRERELTFSGCAFRYLLLCSILASFFMTMLPFPTFEEAKAITTPAVQLIPFHCVYQLLFQTGLVLTDWSTVLPTLKSHVFFSAFFNIIMLMPVGFFLRALFHCSTKRVLLTGFCISLVFELIQLSGLFFIYPRPYRMFDVDDLIGNTFGAWTGYCIEPFFEQFFPLRFRNEYRSRLGGEVSFARRLFADLIDYAFVVLFAWLGAVALLGHPLHPFIAMGNPRFIPLYFMMFFGASAVLAAVTVQHGGRTLGMQAFGLELRSTGQTCLTLRQCFLRTAIQDVTLLLPALTGWLFYAIDDYNGGIRSTCIAFASAVCVICYACCLLSLFINVVTHGEPFSFERISKTKLGLHPNARAERKLQIFYSGRLNPEAISEVTRTIFEFLLHQGFERKKCLRVQYLAEGVLLEWMKNGLTNVFFDLRYDCRFFRKVLLICAPGRQSVIALHSDDSYIELLSGTRLSFDSYFTGDMNVFSIEVP